jgi:hypothetical protein
MLLLLMIMMISPYCCCMLFDDKRMDIGFVEEPECFCLRCLLTLSTLENGGLLPPWLYLQPLMGQ